MDKLLSVLAFGLAPLLLVQIACSTPAPSPEDEIRQLIAQLEKAAGEKDLATLTAHLSEQYSDREGRDRSAIKMLLAYYFLQNRSIHILTQIQSVEFDASDTARIQVLAAFAGTKIPSGAVLPEIRGDIYRFDADLRLEDGKWRLRRASWQPATIEDTQ